MLTDRGLDAALGGLADRSPVPVEILETPDRAAARAGRGGGLLRGRRGADQRRPLRGRRGGDACASRRDNGAVEVEVRDDGVGGADPAAGTGLRGLADRVAALDGELRGRQPAPASGTTVRGEDPVRVVIADDSALLREGVVRLLEEAGLEVVGQAGDGEELLRKVRAHKPDVAVVDVRMPPTHTDEGLRAAREIRAELPEVGGPRALPVRRGRLRRASCWRRAPRASATC